MAHDFKKHPELSNSQMEIYYFESPHKQITEDFQGEVIRVIDGDTIRVKTDFRSFDFPIRLARIQAPEIDTREGIISKEYLENKILNKKVDILINYKNRTGKYGRLIGDIIFGGESMSEAMIRDRQAFVFGEEFIWQA